MPSESQLLLTEEDFRMLDSSMRDGGLFQSMSELIQYLHQ